ncbi:MAG: TOBE domain-containing protein [Thermoplasmatota archaeon]
MVRVSSRTILVAGLHPEGLAEVVVPPHAVLLERSSAAPPVVRSPRNAIRMRVEAIAEEREGVLRVRLAAGALKLESLIVRGAQRELRLRPGSQVTAVIKAVAISLVPA